MKSSHSEGLRRLSGLAAVLAAVAAQSFVVRDVNANQDTSTQTYGVQLLEHQLAAPGSPVRYPPFELAPSVAEPQGSAAILFEVTLATPATKSPAELLPIKWRSSLSERRSAAAVRDWPENRDASGTLIRITENDVLIPD